MKEFLEKIFVVDPRGPVAGGGSFWVHKELSKSYREGTAQKLKSMALPYKTKGLNKMSKDIFWGLEGLVLFL